MTRNTTQIAIVGAGPYGLSAAAHIAAATDSFRIFGPPMTSWTQHMPAGMLLKSDGFASNISDPRDQLTLARFCASHAIPYADTGIPVSLDTFCRYGLEFAAKLVPGLDQRSVAALERTPDGFLMRLEDGDEIRAKQVVLAVGITHFAYIPAELSGLPPELLSHSFAHHDLAPFRGRSVVVVGGGASASDLAGLLADQGAEVTLVARDPTLKFHGRAAEGEKRSLWRRIRHPTSGIGPGLRSRIYCDAPNLFHMLPEATRLSIVRKHLGPAGGWFAKDKVVGRLPLLLGHRLQSAVPERDRAKLQLVGPDGARREIVADHVIAATGYRVAIDRIPFIAPELRSAIACVEGSPVLSGRFESSVPGLFFVGLASATSFGPVMRFAFGAAWTARRLGTFLAGRR